MAKNSQMLKGVLEGCILHIINTEETYGYKICEALELGGFTDISEGSVYPILIRLEKKEYITSIKKSSPLGPKRKYYYLSTLGKEMLADFVQDWQLLKTQVSTFIKD